MDPTFIIVREDLQVDPVTIIADGILIGRLPTCELLLNHPSVSRLHAAEVIVSDSLELPGSEVDRKISC